MRRSLPGRTVALTRPVGPRFSECELTHLEREPIDVPRARAQHAAYEATLSRLGCGVVRLPALDRHPDGVFIEDTLLVLDEVAVVTRPGSPERRKETRGLRGLVAPWRPVETIRPPGTLDGGDVLRLGRTLFVGRSTRTTEEGIEDLRRIVSPFGYAVHALPVAGCLHLKSAASPVGRDLLLVNPAWVDPAAFGNAGILEVSPDEPSAANALRTGDCVIHPSAFPATRARLERAGVSVVPVEVSEILRAEGGVTCCSVVFPEMGQAS